MGFSNITEAIVNVEDIIDQQYQSIDSDSPDGEIIMAIAHNFRIIACGTYLIELDNEEFSSILLHSAQIYYEMITDDNESIKPYYRCLSQAKPFYDALAAGLFDIAAKIAHHFPSECRIDLGENYEDYYSTKVLSTLLLQPNNTPLQEEQLAQLEEIVSDVESPKLLMLKAIIEQDFEAFEESCEEYLQDWSDEQEEMRMNDEHPFYDRYTSSYIFIEGLAYLQIAKLLGYEKCRIDVSFAPRALYCF